MTRQLVTVLIDIYNYGRFIEEAIDSVMAQEFPAGEMEILVVDDVRCFDPRNPEFSAYPPIDFLIDWARKHNLTWHIEHDIFIAKNH